MSESPSQGRNPVSLRVGEHVNKKFLDGIGTNVHYFVEYLRFLATNWVWHVGAVGFLYASTTYGYAELPEVHHQGRHKLRKRPWPPLGGRGEMAMARASLLLFLWLASQKLFAGRILKIL